VVWLQTPPPGAAWPAAPVKVEMDQKGCVFIPRVVLVPAGGTVEFLNSDRLLHNLHSVSTHNPSFNRTQPKGRVIPIAFAKPEIIRLDCDLHSWMRAWVVVADHPFYALSNEAGEFALPSVPPGKYTLQIWQEALGTTSRDVVVGADDARVVVEFKARR
jgi:plastocyanin